MFGRGGRGAINLISLLKETNGILSIIPDLGRIYNLFAPQSIGGKSYEAVALKYWGNMSSASVSFFKSRTRGEAMSFHAFCGGEVPPGS